MPYRTVEQLLQRNTEFAGPGHVALPLLSEMTVEPSHTIVISCFDPRASPYDFLKTTNPDHEIVSIRNAGGRPQHCVHDIVALDNLIGIQDIMIVHHQDCGMASMTQKGLEKRLTGWVKPEDKARHDYEKFDFGCMPEGTLASSCLDDVKFLREHPWIRPGTNVVGYVLDIKTGLLQDVEKPS